MKTAVVDHALAASKNLRRQVDMLTKPLPGEVVKDQIAKATRSASALPTAYEDLAAKTDRLARQDLGRCQGSCRAVRAHAAFRQSFGRAEADRDASCSVERQLMR